MLAALQWVALAISLANTVLLFWLGLTVLFTAEKRTWGIGLVVAGLLTGGFFFVSHTAILGHGLNGADSGLDFWWNLGLLAAIMLPFFWYVVILWYSGFWVTRDSALRQRQRGWFTGALLANLALFGLMLAANPFPSYAQVITLSLSPTPTIGGFPVLIGLYPLCTLLNIALSLDALIRPGPSRRIMGEVARRRVRSWLSATSGLLLLVGLLVAGVMWWVARTAERAVFAAATETIVYALDVLIAATILIAVLSLGQAIVRYEVFTGKTLPQQRFRRHWHNAMTLALGYGVVMSVILRVRIHPVYVVLVVALTLTLFYALFSRHSYLERTRFMQRLRPFLISQRLYDRLVAASPGPDLDMAGPFAALCRDVLGARTARLMALGTLSPLAGPGMRYPPELPDLPSVPDTLITQLGAPQTMCVPVEPGICGGAILAVPLWSERGLIGLFLLGEKEYGGLYTQEDIEIARASGERLIDSLASAEMARRLMALQRQRLAHSEILDRRTRRILHDDVLPRVHEAMLMLASTPGAAHRPLVEMLGQLHRQIADLLREMPPGAAPALAERGLIGALRALLEGEMRTAFEGVTWQVSSAAEDAGRQLPALSAEVVFYAAREAIRNAARYGRGAQAERPLNLRIQAENSGGLTLCIEDDGVGIGAASASRSGSGLALHSTMLAVVGGTLTVESAPNQFTRVWLRLPRSAYPATSAGS